MIVLATDSFFMAMFFFLSGLFVWPSIARKGALNHLADRLRRLALPFVICAFTVIPLAYYAISLRHHPEIGFSEFWWTTITKGPWPSGPLWFLWVLFVFDVIACLLYRLSPHHARSDQSPLAVRSPSARGVLRGLARCHG